jgi:RNA polymerase sigma-70 factor (ECF subfamily)
LPANTGPGNGRRTENISDWSTAISQGNEEAFTRFYDIYSVRLYRHLLVLAKGNETEAREVLQIVVIKLAKRFKVFDDEQRMWSWLCRLAQNAWIDFCRSQQRHRRFVQLEEKTQEFEGTARSGGEHHLAAGLQWALAELDDDEQELMRSAYIDRRSLQELADGCGQTYKAMESRLARLRQKVKKKLLNYLSDENR